MRKTILGGLFFTIFVASLAAGVISCAKAPQKLEKPQNVNVEKRVMTWNKVDGATDYTVKIKDEEFKTSEPRFELYFLTEAGNYYYQVKACGNGKKYSDSSWVAGATTLSQAPEHGYDELEFEYTLLKDKSGYEVSRGNANLEGEIIIPDYYGDYPVKRIANEAFYIKKYKGTINGSPYYDYPDCFNNYLCNTTTTNVQLPSQLESIGAYAMSCMTQLKKVVIPDSVTQIGQGAFEGDIRMERVVLPNKIFLIPDNCFKDTALSEINFPDRLEEIGAKAFMCSTQSSGVLNHVNSVLQRVVLPTSIKTIGTSAFLGRENLTAISFPNGHNLEFVGDSCISGTALYTRQEGIVFLDENKTIACGFNKMPNNFTFEIPANVKYVTQYAFALQKNLKKVVMPSGMTFLGGNTFSSCPSLEEVVFPSDFEMIVDGMFSSTTALKTVSIPESVTYVGGNAFSQSVGIGGFQLGKLTVAENQVYYRAVRCQLFKRFGVGRIARFGFFRRRKHELFKKHRAQLLWRIDIEFLTRRGVYFPLKHGKTGGAHFRKSFQPLFVRPEARMLHIGKHPCKRKFN